MIDEYDVMQELDAESVAVIDIANNYVLFNKLSLPIMDELEKLNNILKF